MNAFLKNLICWTKSTLTISKHWCACFFPFLKAAWDKDLLQQAAEEKRELEQALEEVEEKVENWKRGCERPWNDFRQSLSALLHKAFYGSRRRLALVYLRQTSGFQIALLQDFCFKIFLPPFWKFDGCISGPKGNSF